METHELLLTGLRALAVFAFMLVVIRLLGKRTVGNFTAFDLLVALMLGEVVDEIIYGDVSLLQGAVAILVVAAAKYATSWLNYRFPKLSPVLEGRPTPVVRHGTLQHDGLRSELMNEKELMAALRLQEIRDLSTVRLATIEADGEVSVLKEEWAEPARRADLENGKTRHREAPDAERTDAARYLS